MNLADIFHPQWPAPETVAALVTTRQGGVSPSPYAGFNLALHVGDDPVLVRKNRQRLARSLPSEPCWLEQVHGTAVVEVKGHVEPPPRADAALTHRRACVCAVMTADCLPVLFCDRFASVVAVAHAGWRGLLGGVLESTVMKMGVKPDTLLAWLGPAIGPQAFEVGAEVLTAFVRNDEQAEAAFVPADRLCKRWHADLYRLARLRLARLGVPAVFGGDLCTFADSERFYSYRRDGVTGRFASLIWLR